MTTTIVSYSLKYPPDQFGRWEEVGGTDVLNEPTDSSYLLAVAPSYKPWYWSAGVSRSYHAWPDVPDEALDAPLLRVRRRIRARMLEGNDDGYVWLGDSYSGGMCYRLRVEGNEWQELQTPWEKVRPDKQSWTRRRLSRYLQFLGRTSCDGPILVSQMWFDVEIGTTPAPLVTGPDTEVEGTSYPTIRWQNEDSFDQAGWQVEVYRGQLDKRPSADPVDDAGSSWTGRKHKKRHHHHHRGRGHHHHDHYRWDWYKREYASSLRWGLTEPLDPGQLYTAFVRVARPWGQQLLWSDWVPRTWTMATVEDSPDEPTPPVVEPSPDEPYVPPDIVVSPTDPAVQPGTYSLVVTWPELQDTAFGLGPFGLSPFGGGSQFLEVESADDEDGPWVVRGQFPASDGEYRDRYVPFHERRWYRLRAGLDYESTELIWSRPSEPVSGILEPAGLTATITSVTTGEVVRVELRGKPLEPRFVSRMQVMAAADLGVSTAQGQPAVPRYVGRIWCPPGQYDALRTLANDAGVLVWRDTFRDRFPFVWASDISMEPVNGLQSTPYVLPVEMAVVPWPEGVH